MSEPTTFCKLPNTGLGNQLFPLMKAMIHGQMTNQKVRVCNYLQFKIGPYLRREKSKRKYSAYFTFQKGYFDDLATRITLHSLIKKGKVVINPPLNLQTSQSVLFDAIPHWDNYFEGLKDYRPMVKKIFFEILQPAVLENYHGLSSPAIGVHIRMGDFRKLREGEDFKKLGAVRTPEAYFTDVIRKLRVLYKTDLPITVFTDGYQEELPELFRLPNVHVPQPNTDIGDMLHLSKSKIIVTSAGSTFSYWAGFLSDAPVILHPDHIHQPIRIEENLFEGAINSFTENSSKNAIDFFD